MTVIKLNKSTKDFTLKRVDKNIRLVQNNTKIKLNQTGRRGEPGVAGPQGEIGPEGPQGPSGEDSNFVQEFTNLSEVTVTHSLAKYPAVTVTDSTGDEVEGEVEHLSVNQLIARFSASFTGRIVCN